MRDKVSHPYKATGKIKANSHREGCAPAVLRSCCVAKIVSLPFGLHSETISDSHKRGRALAVLRTCHHERKFSRPRYSTAGAQQCMGELHGRLSTACGRDQQKYPRFFFRLPRGLHEGCYKNTYQSRDELQLASTKVNYVCHG